MSECRVCGSTTDAFVCRNCGNALRKLLRDPHGIDIATLMHEASVLATGQARTYRRNGRAIPIDDATQLDLDMEEAERWRTPKMLRQRSARIALPQTRTMVNLAARAQFDEAWNTRTTLARDLIETRGAETMPPEPITPRSLSDWLADRVNSIRHDEGAADTFAQLQRIKDRLTRLVDRAPSRIYSGPCEARFDDGTECDRPLYAWFNVWRANNDHDETDDRIIVCDGYRPPNDPKRDDADEGCGAEHTPADRADWIIAEMDDRLDTLAFWQLWLPLLLPNLTWPSRSTWYAWRDRRRLEVKTINANADEMFRGGDVIDLVTREQPRIVGNRDRARRARVSA